MMTLARASNASGDWPMARPPGAWLASGLVGLIGCLVLVGWVLDVAVLQRVVPGLVAMNPLTAVTFLLASGSLWLLYGSRTGRAQASRWRWMASVGASLVALVGVLTLVGYVVGRNLGFDQLLFADRLAGNRIAPNTGINFLLVGVALLLLAAETPRAQRLAQGLAVTSAAVALFAVVGYLYGASSLNGFTAYIPMALNTALAFLVLDVGILAAQPGVGLVALATSDTVGGMVLRRLLPAAVGTPIILGWLRLEGQRAGFYDTEFGTVVVAAANAVVFAALVFWLARTLHRMDVERRSAAEDQARLAAIVDSSEDAIIGKALDGTITSWNPGAARLYGYTPGEVIGRPITLLVPPGHEDEVPAILERVRRGERVEHYETRRRTKDGRTIDVALTVSPIRDAIGAILGASVIARDVTARKEADRALQAANRELDAFSYSVSHDLRAPLRAIDGFSRILLEDYGEDLPADGKRYLQIVRDGTVKMGQLVDDLLAFSRLGRQEVRTQTVLPAAVVRRALDELGGELGGREVALAVGNLPPCRADPALLLQVYANLLANALKYTRGRAPARIEVGALESDGSVGEHTYYVRDNGVGFDMAYAPKLFGVFQRLHRAEDYEGTGVGLAIVERIVHRHGGRIWAEAAPDHGATFWFTLPAAEPDAASGMGSAHPGGDEGRGRL